jgi:hypothetical protein
LRRFVFKAELCRFVFKAELCREDNTFEHKYTAVGMPGSDGPMEAGWIETALIARYSDAERQLTRNVRPLKEKNATLFALTVTEYCVLVTDGVFPRYRFERRD